MAHRTSSELVMFSALSTDIFLTELWSCLVCKFGWFRTYYGSLDTRLLHGILNCRIIPAILYLLILLLEKHWWLQYDMTLQYIFHILPLLCQVLTHGHVLPTFLCFLRAKAALILSPRQCILTYNPQCLPLFKLEVIGVHSVTKTIKIFQMRFLQEMLDMMTWEGALFQAGSISCRSL
jgi:hypothetical protein